MKMILFTLGNRPEDYYWGTQEDFEYFAGEGYAPMELDPKRENIRGGCIYQQWSIRNGQVVEDAGEWIQIRNLWADPCNWRLVFAHVLESMST